MSNEKLSFFVTRLTDYATKRATFLKYFDQLKTVAMTLVGVPDYAAMGLEMHTVEVDSFQIRFAGRNFKYAMFWPLPEDALIAKISITEIKKTAQIETETKILTVDYNRHGVTNIHSENDDELQLKTPYDCSIILLHGLRTATGA